MLAIGVGLAGAQRGGHLNTSTGEYEFEPSYAAGFDLAITYGAIGPHTVSLWASLYHDLSFEWGVSFMYGNMKKTWGIGPVLALSQTGYLYGLQGFYRGVNLRAFLGRHFIDYDDDVLGVTFINRTGVAISYSIELRRLSRLMNRGG